MPKKKPTYGDWFSYPMPKTREEAARLESEFKNFDLGLRFVGGRWIQTNPYYQAI
jgi:hypothetical protein